MPGGLYNVDTAVSLTNCTGSDDTTPNAPAPGGISTVTAALER
ncbi:hypothetical protein ABZ845_08905 [Streptomyces sp. NPDC047022]